MPRRRDGGVLGELFEAASVLPWWVGVVLAAVAYALLHHVAVAKLPTGAAAAADGDTARVMEVGNRMGEWESKATYTLARTPEGWRIRSVEMQR